MRPSPLLDFDALTAPLPGDAPQGIPAPFAVRHELEEARKENEADSQRPDWPGIVQTAQETLTRTSKDLVVAARLTEALVKVHGFAGLRAGLHLLYRLVEQCWDRLYPVVEDGDLEPRAAPFNWLDDPDRGARFPTTLRSVPFLGVDGRRYGWLDWQQAQDSDALLVRDALDRVVLETPLDVLRRVEDDLTRSLDELDKLCLSLCMRLGSVAPSLIHLRLALKDCHELVQQVLRCKSAGPAATDVEPSVSARPAQPPPAPRREQGLGKKGGVPFDFGPLGELFDDAAVRTILVNGSRPVLVNRRGKLEETDLRFPGPGALQAFIDRLTAQAPGRGDTPLLNLHLPGLHVYGILPPLAPNGPLLYLEKTPKSLPTFAGLIKARFLTREMAAFLRAAVGGRLNILVSGDLGGGKTSLLNALAHQIPHEEQIILVEDAPELSLVHHPRTVRLTKPAPGDAASAGALLRQAMALRPDRILVDECRGDETLDVLHILRTVQGGSMATVEAHTPAEARSRLEMLVATAHPAVPTSVIRWNVAAAIDVIVQVSRLAGNVRKVTAITEILGLAGDDIRTVDLFRYTQLGVDESGAVGQFEATGTASTFRGHLADWGIQLPVNLFEKRVLERE